MSPGFVKSLLEPCLWLKRGKPGGLEAFVLIEVEDLIVSGGEKCLAFLRSSLTERPHFGKWNRLRRPPFASASNGI
eukprot:360843-Pyramimonas_sp.AAC.1